MSDVSGVTAESICKGILRGLLGPGARFENIGTEMADEINDGILEAENSAERELSTRFAITEFKSFLNASPYPSEAGVEYESAYDWPGRLPGDGWPRWRVRCRPLVELLGVTLSIPSGVLAPMDLPLDWFRVDHEHGDIMMAPTAVGSAVSYQGLAWPMVGLSFGKPIPQSVLLHYKSGLGPDGLKRIPKIRHLVELRAAAHILPHLSVMANPFAVTNQSADGLSESRSSGFIFKDLEERLQKEADEHLNAILDRWDGPQFLVL